MKTQTKMYRKSDWYRPLYLDIDDKTYLLDDIVVFNRNGILARVGRGYFDCDKEFTIERETYRKLKEDFTVKYNFIKKMKDKQFATDEVKYCLYINVDNIDFKDLGLEKNYDWIYHKYSINGLEFSQYVESLDGKKNELSKLAENEIEKLSGFFRYNGDGVEESKLLEIFSNLQNINRQILEQVEYIKNYKVD